MVAVDRAFIRTRAVTGHARRLRVDATVAERKLWSALRGGQLEDESFRRQHPLAGYYLDFYCPALRLAIEVDGGQHGAAKAVIRDAARTEKLEELGIRVLRFWNNEINENLEGVLTCVRAEVIARRSGQVSMGVGPESEPQLSPPPARGRVRVGVDAASASLSVSVLDLPSNELQPSRVKSLQPRANPHPALRADLPLAGGGEAVLQVQFLKRRGPGL